MSEFLDSADKEVIKRLLRERGLPEEWIGHFRMVSDKIYAEHPINFNELEKVSGLHHKIINETGYELRFNPENHPAWSILSGVATFQQIQKKYAKMFEKTVKEIIGKKIKKFGLKKIITKDNFIVNSPLELNISLPKEKEIAVKIAKLCFSLSRKFKMLTRIAPSNSSDTGFFVSRDNGEEKTIQAFLLFLEIY